MKPCLFIAGAVALFSSSAIAGEHYLNAGAGFGSFDVKAKNAFASVKIKRSFQSANFTYGYQLNDYFGVELKANFGLNKDKNLKNKSVTGLYLKGNYPINDSVNLYALFGRASTKIQNDGDNASRSSFSYGLGTTYELSEKWAIGANYMLYHSSTEKAGPVDVKFDYTAFGIFAQYKF
ncbi:MAG: porin family protein [Parashewanella sp.]